jgi:hypothetical protein
MTLGKTTSSTFFSTTFLLIAAAACSSSSSSSPASSADAGGKGDAGSKVPSLSGGKPAGKGQKGGSSTQPTSSSATAGSRTTSSDLKKPAPGSGSGDDPCTGVADGKAVCGSDTALYFCAGQQLYQLDCNALMTSPDYGFAAGACYQTDAVTDCFGCGAAPDGTNVCCAGVPDGLLCCDDQSQCATVASP